jgi:sugar lactone lactonase YvrE
LFIADTEAFTIRQLDLGTHALTTIAGLRGIRGASNGVGAAARFWTPYGVASDGLGNLYVADNGTGIRKLVVATAAVTTFAAAPSNATSIAYYGGTLYIDNDAEIDSVDPTGLISTVAGRKGSPGLVDATGALAEFGGVERLASDGQGNLYVADRQNQVIRKVVISSGQVSTVAGVAHSLGCSPGPVGSTALSNPDGLVFLTPARLYVAGSCGVQLIDFTAGTVSSIAVGGRIGVDGPGGSAGFFAPLSMAGDLNNLYVGDQGAAIRQVGLSAGYPVSTIAGQHPSQTDQDATGSAASFRTINAAVSDGKGNIFVAEPGAIREVALPTGIVTTVSTQFNLPEGLAFDPSSDTLYVYEAFPSASLGAGQIDAFALGAGTVTTLAGGTAPGCVDGQGAAAEFKDTAEAPIPMVLDGAGDLYVADSNSDLRKLVLATGTVSSVFGYLCSGAVSSPDLLGPNGLAIDTSGKIYIANSGNFVVAYDPASGSASVIAGQERNGGYADGDGTSALFGQLQGAALDGLGNLYLADYENDVIRKLNLPTGQVGTVMGMRGVAGVIPGPGPASLNRPNALLMDGTDLIITDLDENVVLRMH